MGLTPKQVKEIRNSLDSYKKPLFFYHDDPDGVCSYLQFYRYTKAGKGIIIKNTPEISTKYLHSVNEYDPDVIYVLDIAMIEQEFLDQVNVPVIWIDHHGPYERTGVKYYNSRLNNGHEPVSYLCHQVIKDDLWLSVLGCIGDWFIPDTIDEFRKKFPGYIEDKIKQPQDALFASKAGQLVHFISMMLKGNNERVKKCIKILANINSPDTFMNPQTKEERFLFKQYKVNNDAYEELLTTSLKGVTDDKLLVITYRDDTTSFTKELSNYLLYRYPDKLIVIGREGNGKIKISLRSTEVNIPKVINKIFQKINGRGGGHEHACGAVLNKEDFKEFLELYRKYAAL